jgi:hypothetical protein
MTRRSVVEIALWVGAAALAAAAMIGWRGAVTTVPASPALAVGTVAAPRVLSAAALARAQVAVAEHDPFRLERRPASVAYSPELEGAPPTPPGPPKPVLVLKGTVGGPPWQGVLEGIPGREGSVLVRKGDTLGGLRVRSVERDAVVVQGMDTTWRLTVRRLWQ